METAQVGVRTNDLRPLLDIYKVTGMRRDELLQLARERRQQVWWQDYKDLPTAAVASLETEAASISQYAAQVIPGLLQTEDYARTVLRAIHFQASPEEIARRLKLRVSRQTLLTDEKAPQYWIVIENTGGDAYIENVDVTRRYNSIFDHLRAAALNPAESSRTLAVVEHELLESERS